MRLFTALKGRVDLRVCYVHGFINKNKLYSYKIVYRKSISVQIMSATNFRGIIIIYIRKPNLFITNEHLPIIQYYHKRLESRTVSSRTFSSDNFLEKDRWIKTNQSKSYTYNMTGLRIRVCLQIIINIVLPNVIECSRISRFLFLTVWSRGL